MTVLVLTNLVNLPGFLIWNCPPQKGNIMICKIQTHNNFTVARESCCQKIIHVLVLVRACLQLLGSLATGRYTSMHKLGLKTFMVFQHCKISDVLVPNKSQLDVWSIFIMMWCQWYIECAIHLYYNSCGIYWYPKPTQLFCYRSRTQSCSPMRFSLTHAVVGKAVYGTRYRLLRDNLHQLIYGKVQF